MSYLAIIAAGALVGFLIGKLAARGRRLRLQVELRQAEAEVERLSYIHAALVAHPFGESIPTVVTARTACTVMRADAIARAAACRTALGPSRDP